MSRDMTARRRFQFHPLGCVITLVVLFLVVILLLPSTGSREAAPRSICKNNLHLIGLALHNYHDVYGCFPPAYIADERGRPMHSWRVLLLPYIDQAPLYNLYRFDEPWDGPNNSQLTGHILAVYQCPTDVKERDTPENWTSYVAVVGPHTCWPGDGSVRFRDVTDGTSDTLLVVEVHNSGIHWMEPRDLHVTQMAPAINAAGMGFSSLHAGGANGLLADGAVRFVSEKAPAETVRRLIERDDGQPVGEF